MRCGSRSLSLVSLGFGLVATGALSLAVATDYWLFTVEPVAAEPTLNMTDASFDGLDVGIESEPTSEDDVSQSDSPAEHGKDDGTKERHPHHQPQQPSSPQQPHPQRSEALLQNASFAGAGLLPTDAEVMIRVHSGLWRMCIVNEEPGENFASCSYVKNEI